MASRSLQSSSSVIRRASELSPIISSTLFPSPVFLPVGIPSFNFGLLGFFFGFSAFVDFCVVVVVFIVEVTFVVVIIVLVSILVV